MKSECSSTFKKRREERGGDRLKCGSGHLGGTS